MHIFSSIFRMVGVSHDRTKIINNFLLCSALFLFGNDFIKGKIINKLFSDHYFLHCTMTNISFYFYS